MNPLTDPSLASIRVEIQEAAAQKVVLHSPVISMNCHFMQLQHPDTDSPPIAARPCTSMETHLSFQFPFPGTQKITHYSQEDAEALVSIFKIKSSKKVTQAPKNI